MAKQIVCVNETGLTLDQVFGTHVNDFVQNSITKSRSDIINKVKENYLIAFPKGKWNRFKEMFAMPWFVGQDFPKFGAIVNRQLTRHEEFSELSQELASNQLNSADLPDKTHEFLQLPVEEKVSLEKILIESDRDQVLFNDAQLKSKGMNQRQILAYKAWKTTMDKAWNKRLEVMEELTFKPYEGESKQFQDLLKQAAGVKGKLTAKKIEGFANQIADPVKQKEFKRAVGKVRRAGKDIADLRNQVGKMKFYVPRVREGRFAIRVFDKKGVEVWQERTDSKVQAGVIKKRLSDRFTKHVITAREEKSISEYFFQRVDDNAMQKFIDEAIDKLKEKGKIGVSQLEDLRDSVNEAVAEELKARGFAKRFIKRRSAVGPDVIRGYQETNLDQVFVDYVSGFSGYLSKQSAAYDFNKLLGKFDIEEEGGIFEYASRYTRDMLRNTRDIDKLVGKSKAFMFHYFMAGNLKTAAVQLTQNFTTGMGELAAQTQLNPAQAVARYTAAMKDASFGKITQNEAKVITDQITKGNLRAQFMEDLTGRISTANLSIFGYKSGSVGFKKFQEGFKTVLDWLSLPFRWMEVFNRQSAFLAMYRQSIKEGMPEADAVRKARDFVFNTHFLMGRANQPQITRGDTAFNAVANMALTFRSFNFNMVHLLSRHLINRPYGTQSLHMVGMSMAALFLFGGALSLPFLDDFLEQLERLTGKAYRAEMRAWVRGHGGEVVEDFTFNGVPGMIGVDLSGSLRMGLPRADTDSVFGVYAGVYQRALNTFRAVQREDGMLAAESIAPIALSNAFKAWRLNDKVTGPSGKVLFDERGRPVKLDPWEVAFQALSFSPVDYRKSSQVLRSIKNAEGIYRQMRNDLYAGWRLARNAKDRRAILQEVRKYNKMVKGISLQVPKITQKTLRAAQREKANENVIKLFARRP